MIHESVVNNLEELLEEIKKLKVENSLYKLWFRGQGDSEWGLTPGIFREAYSVYDKYGNEISPPRKTNFYSGNKDRVIMPNMWSMLDEFQKKLNLDDTLKANNKIQLMEIAQHYGLPTLLLDWTTDPLVALYFALSGIDLENTEEINEKFATIWVIDPMKINQIIFPDKNINRVFNSTEDYNEIESEMELPGTFCFEGTKSHPRICRQSGNFTFTNSMLTYTMDYLDVFQKEIYKINIPYNKVNDIKQLFELLDLSEQSIYFEKTITDEITKKIKDDHFSKYYNILFNDKG